MMFKIVSKEQSKEHIAKMFYRSISYKGKIKKIDININSGMEIYPGGIIAPRCSMVCNQQNPHTEDEFIKQMLKDDNFMSTVIIASLNDEDTRRISVMMCPPELDMSEITEDKRDKDVIAVVNTPMIEPTDAEIDEIIKFIEFLERTED